MPVKNQNLKQLLLSLQQRDLDLRRKVLEGGSLYEGYHNEIEAMHIEHADILANIVYQQGWPGISMVGKQRASAAFTIAQHAISKPTLQKIFLQHLKSAVEAGEASAVHAACLEDRILFNKGMPQKCGMIFDCNDRGELYTHVEDLAAANQRRRQLGLESVEEATEMHRNEIEREGGGPPADIHDHKRKEAVWAKRVGWR